MSHEKFMEEREKLLAKLPNYNEHQHKVATDEQKLKHQVEPLPVKDHGDEIASAVEGEQTVIHIGVPAGDHNEEVKALEEQTAKTEAGE